MTKPIINIRCDGPIINEGTIFVKKEIREDGTVINILFERKGLGTAKEMIKNIFRKKEEINISTENWIKNMAQSAGHSINPKFFMDNIKTAANLSSVSSLHEFFIHLLQNEKNTKFEYEIFVEKAGSLRAGGLDQGLHNGLKTATKLLANDQNIFNQLTDGKALDELINLRNAIGHLQISGILGANEKNQNEFLDKTIDKLTILIQVAKPKPILSSVISDPDGTNTIATENKNEETNYLDEKIKPKPQKLENSASLKIQNENSIIASRTGIENESEEIREIQVDSPVSAKQSIPKNSFIAPESVVIANGEILKKEFLLFKSATLEYLRAKKSDGDDEKKDEGIKKTILLLINLIDIDFLILSLSKTEFSNTKEEKQSEEYLIIAEDTFKALLGIIDPPLMLIFLPVAGKLLNLGFQLGALKSNLSIWNQ